MLVEEEVFSARNAVRLRVFVFCPSDDVFFAALLFHHATYFVENSAGESGGGACLIQTREDSAIPEATFERNTATFGGAIAATDCEFLKVGSSGLNARADFKHNSASVGGAIYIKVETSSYTNCTVKWYIDYLLCS